MGYFEYLSLSPSPTLPAPSGIEFFTVSNFLLYFYWTVRLDGVLRVLITSDIGTRNDECLLFGISGLGSRVEGLEFRSRV